MAMRLNSLPASASNNAAFHHLEAAVLDAIAGQYPQQRNELLAQFQAARVIGRHNSGAGFFTNLEIERQKAAPVTVPRVIGNVWADIDGFEAPMTFLVFTEDGYAKTLEGATCGDGTENVDFSRAQCRLHE